MDKVTKALRISAAINLFTAFAMVFLSGEVSLPVWALVLPSAVWGFAFVHREWSVRARRILTGSVMVLFVLLLARAVTTGNWLYYTVVFTLGAASVRVLQCLTSRQYFQVLVLGFMVMVSGSVMNPDLSFAVLFLPYAVTLTWGLLLTHLRQQVEESAGDKAVAWKASALVKPSLFLGTSALALVLLLTSLVGFFFFPRLGLGFFSSQTRKGSSMSGFSDQIDLGHFGRIQESDRVVVRLEFPGGGTSPVSPIRLTGMTFDLYTGKGWRKTFEPNGVLRKDDEGFFITPWAEAWNQNRTESGNPFSLLFSPDSEPPEQGPGKAADALEYDLYVEPMLTERQVVFGLSHLAAVRPAAASLDRFRNLNRPYRMDHAWDITWLGPQSAAMAYTARSVLPVRDSEALRQAGDREPRWIRRFYLQLPEELDPRIPELAREVTRDAVTRYDKVRALEKYLLTHMTYSLEGAGMSPDPLADFLFGRREGHCEYFSTAMAVLVRTLDIPARSANGFMGGSFNEYGNYYAFTEADAHSWVEVYFPEFGWIPFDPTPAAALRDRPEPGFLDEVGFWMDTLRLQWYKWVIEYDLEQQLRFYAGLWNSLTPDNLQVDLSGDISPGSMRRTGRKLKAALSEAINWSLIFAGMAALTLILVGYRLRNRLAGLFHREPGARWEARIRRKVRRILPDLGPEETLGEAGARLSAMGSPLAGELLELAGELNRLRWSRVQASRRDYRRLYKRAASLRARGERGPGITQGGQPS